jgi:hypothetical protein
VQLSVPRKYKKGIMTNSNYCGPNSTIGPTSGRGIKATKGLQRHSATAVYSSITSSCRIKVV